MKYIYNCTTTLEYTTEIECTQSLIGNSVEITRCLRLHWKLPGVSDYTGNYQVSPTAQHKKCHYKKLYSWNITGYGSSVSQTYLSMEYVLIQNKHETVQKHFWGICFQIKYCDITLQMVIIFKEKKKSDERLYRKLLLLKMICWMRTMTFVPTFRPL